VEPKEHVEAVAEGLLGRPLAISQIAVVTHDLEKTIAQYTRLLVGAPGTSGLDLVSGNRPQVVALLRRGRHASG
jgi:hypothetical protein